MHLPVSLPRTLLVGVQVASSCQPLGGLPPLFPAFLLKDVPFLGLPTSKTGCGRNIKAQHFGLTLHHPIQGQFWWAVSTPDFWPSRLRLFWAWLQFVVFSLCPNLLQPSCFQRYVFPQINLFVNPASTGTRWSYSTRTFLGSVLWMFFWSGVFPYRFIFFSILESLLM